jgi:uncharacterized protein
MKRDRDEETMNRVGLIVGLAVSTALVLASAAQGHVTVQPDRAPAGGFVRLDVRVPDERDDASTTRVAVQLPDGFADASYEPIPGWTVKVKKTKLTKPIKTDEGEVTDGVKQVTWTSRRGIPPGGFQDFGLSVQVPGKTGDILTFKALQTYSNGEIVRWIGAKGSDAPAPIVSVGAASGSTERAGAEGPPSQAGDSGGSDTLAIVALIIGALGLAAGAAALRSARRAAALSR